MSASETTESVLGELTLSSGGTRAIRLLMKRHVRNTVQLMQELGPTDEPDVDDGLASIQGRVSALADDAKMRTKLYRLFHRVTVSGLVYAAMDSFRNERADEYVQRLRILISVVAWEMAADSLLEDSVPIGFKPWDVAVPWPAAAISIAADPGIDRIELSNSRVATRSSPDGSFVVAALDRAELEAKAESLGFVITTMSTPIDDTVQLSFYDALPIHDEGAHPEMEGHSVTLGDRPASEWAEAMASALEQIGQWLPEIRAEMAILMQQWLPIGYLPEEHHSLSIQAAVGSSYLSLHPMQRMLCEAMIHEFQHNKLHMLMNLDPILVGPRDARYQSPVRPDPRPLMGVLLAVHAFVPVVEFFHRRRHHDDPEMSHPYIKDHVRALVENNRAGMDVLREHGRFTTTGKAFVAVLDRLERKQFAREIEMESS